MAGVSSGLLDFEGAAEGILGRIAETFAFAELSKKAFEAAEEVEEAMDQIAKVTGATGGQLEELGGTFKNVFGDSVQSADDLSGGLAILAQRSGATGEELTALTDINSKFAQVTDQQLKPAVEATQKLFQSWGIETKDQSDKLDALVAVSQKTATSMATLTSNLQGSGAVLRTMGVDFDTAAALMANFNAKGLDVERVAAALKMGLTALAKEGFKDPEAAMGALIQKMIEAKSPMDALTIATEDFGKRGALYIVDAARQGGFAIGELKTAADNARGTIVRTADETESFGEKMKKLANQVTLTLEPMGKPMLDAMTGLAIGAQESALGFKDMGEAIGGLMPDFVKMILSAQSMVGLGTAIGFVGAAVAGVAETAHSAALLLTDLATGTLTGDFSQLAKDWESHGIAMNKAWVTNFQEIAEKGDAAREKLDHLFVNSQLGAQTAGLAAFGLGKEVGNLGATSAGAGEKIMTLSRAFETLGVKVAPTQAEFNKLANAMTFIQAQFDAGKISSQTYGVSVDDFVKKMSSLQGAFVEASQPVDVLGRALKEAGISDSAENFAKLTRGVDTAAEAFLRGRITAGDYAGEIAKLNQAEASLLDPVKKANDAFLIAGNQLKAGTGTIGAYDDALQDLLNTIPPSQDAFNKLAAKVTDLSAAWLKQTIYIPTVDSALKNLGQKTMKQLNVEAKNAQADFDSLSEAFRRGEVSSLVLDAAWQRLHNSQIKLSQDKLDAQKLGIPDIDDLDRAVKEANRAFENLSSHGLLNVNTSLEANIHNTRLAIEQAFQHGQSTTDLQIKMNGLTLALEHLRDGWDDSEKAGKQMFVSLAQSGKDLIGLNWGSLAGDLASVAKSFAGMVFDPRVLLDIRRAIDADLTTALKDLITGVGDVGAAFKKLGEDVLDIILNKIIALGIQKMFDLLAGVGGTLGSIGTALGGVAGGLAGAASQVAALGTNTAAIAANTAAVAALTTSIGGAAVAGAAGSAAGAAGGVANAAGGIAGGIGQAVGASIAPIMGIVTGAISAVTGVISVFQNMHQETSLNAIESNTRRGALWTLAVQEWVQGIAEWNGNTLFPMLQGITAWETYIVSAITNDLPAKLTASISGAFSSALKDAWLNVIGVQDLKNGLASMIDFSWTQVAPDLGRIQSKLDMINQSIATSKGGVIGGAAAPQFKIYLDGRELLQSVVVALSQSGTVAPAT